MYRKPFVPIAIHKDQVAHVEAYDCPMLNGLKDQVAHVELHDCPMPYA